MSDGVPNHAEAIRRSTLIDPTPGCKGRLWLCPHCLSTFGLVFHCLGCYATFIINPPVIVDVAGAPIPEPRHERLS